MNDLFSTGTTKAGPFFPEYSLELYHPGLTIGYPVTAEKPEIEQ
jgi:hypothetical protein